MDLSSHSVALTQCRDYDYHILAEAFGAMWLACGCPVSLRGAHVLLKPNLITARQGLLACTEARFILAAAGWFLDHGSRVSVGDSPAFSTAESVLSRLGILSELKKLGVQLTNFKTVRSITLPSGVRAGFAVDALDCDLLVNLPRVKAHTQVRVTMAVKNYFGCITGMRRPLWHMTYGGCPGRFESLLVELLSVLPNSISLVDGITAMHTKGPVGGKPFPLGITACSTNPVALDRALLDIIGVTPQDSPLMMECMRLGFQGSSFDELLFPLMRPSELAVEGFKVPGELSPVRFNPFRFVKNSLRRMFLRLGVNT